MDCVWVVSTTKRVSHLEIVSQQGLNNDHHHSIEDKLAHNTLHYRMEGFVKKLHRRQSRALSCYRRKLAQCSMKTFNLHKSPYKGILSRVLDDTKSELREDSENGNKFRCTQSKYCEPDRAVFDFVCVISGTGMTITESQRILRMGVRLPIHI